MAKKIVSIPLFLILIILTVFCISFIKRTPILSFLTVNTPTKINPDLIVVLGGGIKKGKLGISTKERLNEFLNIYNSIQKKPKVLICEYPEGKKKMELFIIEKVNSKNFAEDSLYKYSEKIGGTENNIKDVLTFLKSDKNIKNVLIITSPYHQKRTNLIIGRQIKIMKIDKNINFYFYHMKNQGEILTCSNKRFAKLIFHELGGIIFELLFK